MMDITFDGNIVVALIIGFILKDLCNIAWHAWTNRPRRFVSPGNYYDPCGPNCKMKHMSKIGWRERTAEEIDRIAQRLRSAGIRRSAHERRRAITAAREQRKLRPA